MLTLSPVTPITVATEGRTAITATFTGTPTRLEWLIDGTLKGSLYAPFSPVTFEVPLTALDAGQRDVQVRLTPLTGPLETASVALLVTIPTILYLSVPDPKLALRGSPRWLAEILQPPSSVTLRALQNGDPAVWLDWPGGGTTGLSERLAVYSSTELQRIPRQIYTATQWELAKGNCRELTLFRTPVDPETLRLWQGLETLAAQSLERFVAGGEFTPFNVNLLGS